MLGCHYRHWHELLEVCGRGHAVRALWHVHLMEYTHASLYVSVAIVPARRPRCGLSISCHCCTPNPGHCAPQQRTPGPVDPGQPWLICTVSETQIRKQALHTIIEPYTVVKIALCALEGTRSSFAVSPFSLVTQRPAGQLSHNPK